MCAKWIEGYDPKRIASKIEAIRSNEDNGQVSFDNVSFNNIFYYNEYLTILESMISLSDDIPLELRRKIIESGLIEEAKDNKITYDKLINRITKKEKEYLQSIKNSYILASTISLKPSETIPKVVLGDCQIMFSHYLPSKIDQSRSELLNSESLKNLKTPTHNFMSIRAYVKARNEIEAVEKSMNSIDFIRGIWVLLRNDYRRLSFNQRKPVNKITLGYIHTLHKSDGSLATEKYWYEEENDVHSIPISLSKNNYKTIHQSRKIRTRIKKSPFKVIIDEALIRYVRALDHTNYNNCFIKLWALLEHLTRTMNDNYSTTIKRTSSFYEDEDYHLQVLKHLKNYRNKTVHSGESISDIEIYIFQLKGYIEQLIRFYLKNPFKFKSTADLIEFMDLPTNEKILKRKDYLITSRLKFIK